MLDWFYDSGLTILYPVIIILIMGATELGARIGWRRRRDAAERAEISTLTGASLGLLALLLGFSFSLALSRYDVRRALVLEEANAIGSTANFALMLPASAQQPILGLLRDYTAVRIGLGVPFDPAKFQRDIARSVDIQTRLWQQAAAITAEAPQSLPTHRFVVSLNEMNNIHERRVTALRYRVPGAVTFTLIGVAMMAMGITGYHAGMIESQRHMATQIMSLTVAVVILLIVDLDRPARGLVQVPVQALLDAEQGIPSGP
jgi:hypothetical protein